MKTKYDVIIIGGGPAGLASAIQAKKTGAEDILIIERNDSLGGILPQCIHNGFGSVIYKKDYPGPTYASRFIDEALDLGIEVLLDTMVTDITPSRKVYATNSHSGYLELNAKALVLAMGCRERTRAQIKLPGTRPAGVFSAGTAQRLINIEGYMPGKEFVILGSGDIGMIMARRLTLEGAKVHRVLEILPFLSGLKRNYVQCLQDFDIPLHLSTTVKRIMGKDRVTGIVSVGVDESLQPIPGTEESIPCDTLLLSVGLIPENELSRRAGVELDPLTGGPLVDESMATNVPGIFSAGNVVSIYDLVDYVTLAGYRAGESAARYAKEDAVSTGRIARVQPAENIRTIIPQRLNVDALGEAEVPFEFRVGQVFDGKILIDLVAGHRVIRSFRKPYARPAEMESVKVKGTEILEALSGGEDEISLRAVEV